MGPAMPDSADGEQEGGKGSNRWRPGQSGNPAGRAQGSRNRATVALDALLENDGEAIVKKALDMAKAGDPVAYGW